MPFRNFSPPEPVGRPPETLPNPLTCLWHLLLLFIFGSLFLFSCLRHVYLLLELECLPKTHLCQFFDLEHVLTCTFPPPTLHLMPSICTSSTLQTCLCSKTAEPTRPSWAPPPYPAPHPAGPSSTPHLMRHMERKQSGGEGVGHLGLYAPVANSRQTFEQS